MKVIKNLKKLRIKSDKELMIKDYEKKKIMNKKIGNSKTFTNVKSILSNGIIELKSGEYAYLFHVQAVDISLSSSLEQNSFYYQLRQLYLIKGLNLKQYKLDKDLNFNNIEENLNYTYLKALNNAEQLSLLEEQKKLLDFFKHSKDRKSSTYYWVIISDSVDKLKEIAIDVEQICSSLNNPIYLTLIKNQLEIKQFLQDLYFQDCNLSQLVYNDLYDTIIPRTVEETPNYLKIDDYYVQMVSIKRMASKVYKDFIDGIFNTPNIKSSISIYDNFDTSKFINTLDYNYRSLKTDRNNSKKLSDVTELDEQDEAMQLLMSELKTGNEKLKMFTLNLALYAKDEKSLNEIYKNLKAYCSTSSVDLDICRFRQLEAWQNFDLTTMSFKDYSKPQPTLTISASFSNSRSYFLDPKGYYLGYDYTSGLPVYYDCFHKTSSRKNYNIAVVGTSGSGKSFTIKKMLLNEYARGSKIFILDAEKEYGDLVKSNGGHFINLYSRTGGMINPLQLRLLPSEDEENISEILDNRFNFDSPLAKHLGYLETFFHTAFESLSEKEWILLSKLLETLYQRFGITRNSTVEDLEKFSNNDYPILTDLINLIKEYLSKDLGEERNILLKQLDILVSKFESGPDYLLFNGHTTIDLDNDIICFDLQELLFSKNARLISTQMLSLLTYLSSVLVANKIKNERLNKEQRMIIAVDEIHLYNEYIEVLTLLSQLCRRVRKYLGSFLFATQSVQDLVGSNDVIKYSRAIFNNCQYQFIGHLTEDDFKAYKDLFQNHPLTDTQVKFLSSSTIGQFLLNIDDKNRLLVCIDATDLEQKKMGELKQKKVES